MKSFLIWVAIAIFAWGAGLAKFVNDIPAPIANQAAISENVIVLTGGGGNRIKAAMDIFAANDDNRMLISGVNPDISRASIANLWDGAPEKFDCCVDLGRDARTTLENAFEARDWIKKYHYASVTLVTSEFHMQRALLELKMQMPQTEIIPYAVRSAGFTDAGRPNSFSSWQNVAGEYSKFLIARVRALFT